MGRLLVCGAIVVWMAGCAPGEKEVRGKREGKGGVVYGGVFRYAETERMRSLFPPSVTEVVSYRIGCQIFEGLVKFDQATLEVVPALAENWNISEDGKSYVFRLRQGIKFHDDPCFSDGKGREVTANDVAYCFTFLCTPHPYNQMFWLVRDKIKGAEAYYEAIRAKKPVTKVEGITVLDKYTIRIDLERPVGNFLTVLAHSAFWVWPREALEKYGEEIGLHPVGTGPFKLKLVREGETILLERNPSYWRFDKYGNHLPYLDLIKVVFVKDKKTELLEFRRGNLDMVYRLPFEMISEIMLEFSEVQAGKKNVEYQLQSMPQFAVNYYGFLQTSPIFSNKKVRQAFNYAVDKDLLVNKVMQGEGIPARYGILPEGFKDFPYSLIQSQEFNVNKARALMAEAGYPGGRGFPEIVLQINAGGGNNRIVAENVASQLSKNLDIKIKIEEVPWNQHLDLIETGRAPFFRLGWIADYPDPENFLVLFWGKNVPEDPNERSYINPTRYKNPQYDALFEEGVRTIDKTKRYQLFAQALQILIEDAVILPLYYDESQRLLARNIRNFPQNPMEYRDLSEVYFKEEGGEEVVPITGEK